VVTTTQNRNLDRILLAVAGQQETVSVSSLVGAALVQFSDSYARTRIRELRARGLLEQEGTGGPYRLTAAGRAMLTELDGCGVTA
jgi:DNA-binding IscR family transcriptional regulator